MDEDAPGDAPHRLRAFAIAAALAALAYAVPLPHLSEEGRRLTAVVAAVATLWVTEALPLAATAVLGPAVAVGAPESCSTCSAPRCSPVGSGGCSS